MYSALVNYILHWAIMILSLWVASYLFRGLTFDNRTSLLVSAIGAQEMISDSDVEAVRTRRREDLPGQPFAWKVAVVELISRLTGNDLQR